MNQEQFNIILSGGLFDCCCCCCCYCCCCCCCWCCCCCRRCCCLIFLLEILMSMLLLFLYKLGTVISATKKSPSCSTLLRYQFCQESDWLNTTVTLRKGVHKAVMMHNHSILTRIDIDAMLSACSKDYQCKNRHQNLRETSSRQTMFSSPI